METSSNPWKTALIAAAIGIPALGIAYAGGSRMLGASAPAESASRSPALVEDCNRFAARARDDMRIVKNGAVGGVVGAGVGAAGGAIAGLFIHDLVGLFVTPLGWGAMYYFVPLLLDRPIWSHALSLIGF